MKMMKTIGLAVAWLSFAGLAGAASLPSLKGTPEAAGATGLKVRVFSGAQAVPAIQPAAQRYRWTRGDESGEVTHYDVEAFWRAHELGCKWTDRKGNTLTLATVTAACPEFENPHEEKAKIEAAIRGGAADFKEPSNEALAAWAAKFAGKGVSAEKLRKFSASGVLDARIVDFPGGAPIAAFFKSKDGAWRYVAFGLAGDAEVKAKDADRLVKNFLAGVVVDKSKAKAGEPVMEGKWATLKIAGYVFKTDLPKSQRNAFLRDLSRYMTAMQAAYRRYVPPQKELGESTIRVFATETDYHDYLKRANVTGLQQSIGLWNPTLEELLVLNQGKDVAQRRETMKIMRHEAFHQYLHYATGNGDHAMWFNEGFACFFENVLYSAKSNAVRFYEDAKDRRAGSVLENPEKYANLIPKILKMDHDAFYSGSLEAANDKYTAAWATIYFLSKGAQVFEEFAPYRNVLATYLKETAAGKSWDDATKIAWEGLSGRVSADFLKFWAKRAGARTYEPPAPRAAAK